jgi:hypothetical protein
MPPPDTETRAQGSSRRAIAPVAPLVNCIWSLHRERPDLATVLGRTSHRSVLWVTHRPAELAAFPDVVSVRPSPSRLPGTHTAEVATGDGVVGGRGDVQIIRVYLPPDTNTLLSVAGYCLRSRQYANVIVAGKHPALTYLTMDEASLHCTHILGIWPWAGNTDGQPDVVLACARDVPTLETLAAELLRTHLPHVKVRVINVVDLMRLEPPSSHPHLGPARHRLSVGGGSDAHAASCLLRTARLGDEDFPSGGQHECGARVPARRPGHWRDAPGQVAAKTVKIELRNPGRKAEVAGRSGLTSCAHVSGSQGIGAGHPRR